MERGSTVQLLAYGDEVITRTIVAVTSGVVLVCREDEWVRAQRTGREPTVVGFPVSAVIQPTGE
jgi:hypothetical protein